MNEADRAVHDALGRLVEPQPPPPRSDQVLAAGRRARRRRSLLTGAGAAAGVVATITAAVLIVGSADGDREALVEPSPTPTAVTVPGMPPEQAQQILSDCIDALERSEQVEVPRESAQLYNAGPTPWGTRYLIYGPKLNMDCLAPSEGGGYRAGGSVEHQTEWLPGPLVIDRGIADGMPGGAPAVYTVVGRVIPSVAKVEITYGSGKLTVPAVNGTFTAAVRFPEAEIGTGQARHRALDSDGREIYATTPLDYRDTEAREAILTECWVAPDGTVVIPPRSQAAPTTQCKPAVRWR